jgi:t-SNARE complex subunit (syntaxin)
MSIHLENLLPEGWEMENISAEIGQHLVNKLQNISMQLSHYTRLYRQIDKMHNDLLYYKILI